MSTTMVSPPTTSCRRLRLTVLAFVTLLCTAATAQAAVTDAFTADFTVTRGELALGTTTFGLEPAEREGCYVYTGRAHPNAVVRMFIGEVTDESRFCIDDGRLRPQHFRHHIDGEPGKSYTLEFDWDAHEVVYENETGKHKTMALDDTALDPLSIQIAARRWLAKADDPAALDERSFPIVDEDEIKTYRLRVSDGGVINTADGRFDTLRVERVDDPKRHLRFWLAREADWIPIRVEHEKGDDGIFRMNLTKLTR